MTLLPQPASEIPPPLELQLPPPDRTPRIRRFLLWSGWMVIGLALLNIALFRRHGVDLYLVGILLGAVPCFLYQRFSGTMRIVKWFWVMLTLPYWALMLYLVLQMGGALYLQATVPPVPASTLTLPEYTEEQKRVLALLVEKYGDENKVPGSVEKLYQAWNESQYRAASIQEFVTDPSTASLIETAAPILDEYVALSNSAPPNARDIQADKRLWSTRARYTMPQLVRRAWLFHHGRISEAQQLYLLQLKSNLNHLSFPQPYTETSAAISNSLRIVRYQQEHYPQLTKGIERETLDLVQRIRPRLRIAAADSYGPAELRRFQQSLSLWQHDEAFADDILSFPAPLVAGLLHRFRYWPLLLPEATLSAYRQRLGQMRGSIDLDPVAARKLMMEMHDTDWTALARPNVGGIVAMQAVGNAYPISHTLVPAESILEAYEHTLRWQLREETSTPATWIDPATKTPYVTRTTSVGGIETLVIAGGGAPRAPYAAKAKPTPMEKRLIDLGITNATYLLEVTRPAATP